MLHLFKRLINSTACAASSKFTIFLNLSVCLIILTHLISHKYSSQNNWICLLSAIHVILRLFLCISFLLVISIIKNNKNVNMYQTAGLIIHGYNPYVNKKAEEE